MSVATERRRGGSFLTMEVVRGPCRAELLAVLALLVISAYLRLYRLNDLPPGLLSDIATNGLDGRDVLNGHWQIFFPANNGREAFFIYFQTLLMAFGGTSVFVFSWSAVAMGMLTIALTYRLFRAMFGWWPAWLAAAFLSSSLWFMALSRIGLRTVSLPPFLVASLYLLWRLLRTGRRRYAGLAGVAVGASLYTYLAARLLPVLMLGLCLADWRAARKCWRELLLAVGVAVLIVTPEGIYFFQHPQEFMQRTGEVAVFNTNTYVEGSYDTPLQSLANTAGMFFVHGDDHVRYNIPGRPVFDPAMAALFAFGLAGSLWLARKVANYRWLVLWLAVMSIPSALSHESPDTFRVLSVAPVVFVFPALAIAWLARRPVLQVALGGLAVAWCVVTVSVLFFGRWAADPRIYDAYDGSASRLASFIAGRTEPALFFAFHTRWPVLLQASRSQTGSWYADDVTAIPIPRSAEDTLYASSKDALLRNLNPAYLPGLIRLPHTSGPNATPDFVAFRWPAADEQRFIGLLHSIDGGNMNPDFQLLRYSLASSGDASVLNLVWQPLHPAGPYDLYVHIMDSSGKQVAQSDELARPPDAGSTDESLLLSQHVLHLGAGVYVAEIGAVHRDPDQPGKLVGGPIGAVVRLPITIGP